LRQAPETVAETGEAVEFNALINQCLHGFSGGDKQNRKRIRRFENLVKILKQNG
jgi:hypothetical protein